MIKAIETVYNGYRFRSRLEARWAVFFDELCINYDYEPEGYDLGEAGWYLPDFWLPDLETWIEIKHDKGTPSEGAKIDALCLATKQNAMLVSGDPMMNVLIAQGDVDVAWCMRFGDGGFDEPYLFCLCPWCGKAGLQFDGRGARVCGYEKHYETEGDALNAIEHLGHWRADDKCYTAHHPRIVYAAGKARQARFEFGETP